MAKKILHRVLQVVPFLFFAAAVFLILQIIVAMRNERTPEIFGYSIFLVVSPSMEDTIMTGDLIFVDVSATEFDVDDIITFRQPGDDAIIITHRIVDKTTIDDVVYYTTKGDNNNSSADFEIDFTGDHIIGKYAGKSSFLGNAYQFIYTGGINLIYGTVVLVFVLIGVTEAIHLIKTIGEQKKKQYEEEKDRLIEEEKERLRKEMSDKQQGEE